MAKADSIKHPGIVVSIKDKQVNVLILSQSACSSCHAKGMCAVSDMKEKIIQAVNSNNIELKVGQEVMVSMKKSSGTQAVLMGYFYPFLLVVASLFILSSVNIEDGISALISLGLLIPYYSVLYYFRNKLKKKFIFELSIEDYK